MSVTQQELLRLAKLAKLEIPVHDRAALAQEMSQIVAFASEIRQAAPDSGSAHRPVCQSLREDEMGPSWPQEEILRNAPEDRDGFFYIPGKR